MKLALVLTLALGAVACGSSSNGSGSGTATVNGTLGGAAFAVADAASANTMLFIAPVTAIEISNVAGVCSSAQANNNQKNSRSITWILIDKGASGNSYATVSAPGTYAVYDLNATNFPATGKYAVGSWNTYDGTCNNAEVDFIGGGNVTITAVDTTGSLTGTFDSSTAAGDHITGSFRTSGCVFTPSDGGTLGCK